MNKEDLKKFIEKTSIEIDSIKFHNDCNRCGVRQNRREWNVNAYFNIRDMIYKDGIYSYTQKCKSCYLEYSISFTKDFVNELIVLTCLESFSNYINCTFGDATYESYHKKYLMPKCKDITKNTF